jgi:hypothetical protein
MARAARREIDIDLDLLLEDLEPRQALDKVARFVSKLAREDAPIDLRPLIEGLGLKRLLDSLTPAEREKLKRQLR